MNLYISLRSEMLKAKRTASLYFTGLAAMLIPLVFFIDVSSDGMEKEHMKDPLNAFFLEGAKGMGVIIFPLFIVLLCTLLAQTEYRNNTWKQLLASPQTMAQVYIAKFMHVQLFILLFLLLYNLLMVLSLACLYVTVPAMGVNNHHLDVPGLIRISFNLYVSVWAISAVQFWVGLRFRNFVVSIAIGVMLWLTACFIMLEMHLTCARLFPFCLPIMSVFERYQPELPFVLSTSAGYAAVFLILGYVDFKRRKIGQ